LLMTSDAELCGEVALTAKLKREALVEKLDELGVERRRERLRVEEEMQELKSLRAAAIVAQP